MADEHRLERALRLELHAARQRAGVDRDAVVDDERAGPVLRGLAAVAADDAEVQAVRLSLEPSRHLEELHELEQPRQVHDDDGARRRPRRRCAAAARRWSTSFTCTSSTPTSRARSAADGWMRTPSPDSSPNDSAWRLRPSSTRAFGSGFSRIWIISSAESSRRASFFTRRSAISVLFAIICSSVAASMTRHFASSSATAVAVRGLSLRIAISPTNSPRPSVASGRSCVAHLLEDLHDTRLDDEHLLAALPLPEEHVAGQVLAPEAHEERVGHAARAKSKTKAVPGTKTRPSAAFLPTRREDGA